MKRKLFVIVIALILAASVVGASFALYVKTDSKDIGIGYDATAVKLGFGNTSLGSVTYSPKAGESSHVYEITLTKTGTGEVTNMKGYFRVDIVDNAGGNLSEALDMSATITPQVGDPVTKNKAELTDINGYTCSLSNLPQSVDLTVTLTATDVNFMDYAEESVTITLHWIPYNENWYYLRTSETGWMPDPNRAFVDNPNNVDEVMILNLHMNANEEFKIKYNGDSEWYKYFDEGEGQACQYNSTTDNLYVAEAGTYNFFFNKTTHKVWVTLVEAD